MKQALFIFIYCLLHSQFAFSCQSFGLNALILNHEDIVDVSHHIVMAKVEEVTNLDNSFKKYHLLVEEVIKTRTPDSKYYPEYKNILPSVEPASIFIDGEIPNRFTYVSPARNETLTDYNKHTDKSFWKEGGKFATKGVDWLCSYVHELVEGGSYLIFIDSLNNNLAAELIKSKDDEWYKFVKDKVIKDGNSKDYFLSKALMKPYWYEFEPPYSESILQVHNSSWRTYISKNFKTPESIKAYIEKFPENESVTGFYSKEFGKN